MKYTIIDQDIRVWPDLFMTIKNISSTSTIISDEDSKFLTSEINWMFEYLEILYKDGYKICSPKEVEE